MRRILSIMLFTLALSQAAFSGTMRPNGPESVVLFEKREVVATIPFEHNDYKLSAEACSELEKQFAAALAKCGSRGIIRLEGFSAPGETIGPQKSVAQLRAKEAWNYLRKKNQKERGQMYMTWFDGEQNLSTANGGRLEIAVYENPFAAELERAIKSRGSK